MFESLSDKLQGTFDRLGRKGKLTEQDVDAEALVNEPARAAMLRRAGQ